MRRRTLPNRPGFLLLEVMLGIVVFGLFLGAAALTLLHGQINTARGGDRVRAIHGAERVLDATRAIRDAGFSGLATGAHGVALNGAKKWAFSGSTSVLSGGYISAVTVTLLATDWVKLEASTKWKHGATQSGSVTLTAELTDWRTVRSPGNWSSVTLEGSHVEGTDVLFNDVAVAGSYAYATSDPTGGGAGLYVFDIASTASPSRVLSSFSLGAGIGGYDVAIRGQTLYVVTSDASSEIRAYDISNPTASLPLRTSFNLSGSSLATSLALRGTTLLVGASQHETYGEAYAFDISDSSAIVYRSHLDHGAAVNAVAFTGTSAFLGTSDGAAELRLARATSTGFLAYPATSSYNLIDGSDVVRSVAVSGTAAILGRQRNSFAQEMVFFHANNVGGTVNSWRVEGSGSLLGVDMDPAECYAFLAADTGKKALQVISIRGGSFPELTSYDSASGAARGIEYEPVRDRLFVLTKRGFLIFRPTSSTSVCS